MDINSEINIASQASTTLFLLTGTINLVESPGILDNPEVT